MAISVSVTSSASISDWRVDTLVRLHWYIPIQEIYFIFNLFFSPICLLLHVYHQYADPTDEPNSQVYDQTFEDYELSIQDWKGENNQILFNKNT